MRSFLIAAAMCVVLAAGLPLKADAVGLYAVGKEECKCSPLVARGIIPDPLNQLSDAFAFSHIAFALDRLALGIKDMVGEPEGPAMAAIPEEEIPAVKEKEEKEAKPAAIKKKPLAKAKAKPKKKYKKKRVPQPTRSL